MADKGLWGVDEFAAQVREELLEMEDQWELLCEAVSLDQTVRGCLERFVARVETGRPIPAAMLMFMAEGVKRHLDDPSVNPWPVSKGKGGRPQKNGEISDEMWRAAADVQFYRRLLPAFNGRKKEKLSVLAAQLHFGSDKSISNLEKLTPPLGLASGRLKHPFNERIGELIRKEGLKGVEYCSNARRLYLPGPVWCIGSGDDEHWKIT